MAQLCRQEAPDIRGELYRALLGEVLWFPSVGNHKGDDGTFFTCGRPLVMYDNQKRASAFVFTSEETLRRWLSRRTLIYDSAVGRQVFVSLAACPVQCVYLNAGSVPWGVLSRFEIDALAKGEMPKVALTEMVKAPKGSAVLFSAPKETTSAPFSQALAHIVKEDFRIAFAYLPLLELNETMGSPQYALVLVLRTGVVATLQEILVSIGPRIDQVIGTGQHLDILLFKPDDGLLPAVLRTGCLLAVNDHVEFDACLRRVGP